MGRIPACIIWTKIAAGRIKQHWTERPMTSTKSVEQRLAAAAKKANRDRDAVQAVKEYSAEKARVDANTLRLRALRLEKEAAEAQAAAEVAAQKKATARSKPARARARSGTAT